MRLVIFKRRLGWYWKLVAKNGRTVAIGGEPFRTAIGVKRSFEVMRTKLAREDYMLALSAYYKAVRPGEPHAR